MFRQRGAGAIHEGARGELLQRPARRAATVRRPSRGCRTARLGAQPADPQTAPEALAHASPPRRAPRRARRAAAGSAQASSHRSTRVSSTERPWCRRCRRPRASRRPRLSEHPRRSGSGSRASGRPSARPDVCGRPAHAGPPSRLLGRASADGQPSRSAGALDRVERVADSVGCSTSRRSPGPASSLRAPTDACRRAGGDQDLVRRRRETAGACSARRSGRGGPGSPTGR